MEEKPGDVLTIEVLAVTLKMPKSRLYKLVREGRIPSRTIGRHRRFRNGAIDRWLEETRATVSPGAKRAAQSASPARGPRTGRDSEPGC